MNQPTSPACAWDENAVRGLQGRIVLVKSTRDRRNPPAAMRGWIEVHTAPDGAVEPSVAVEFPQMFTATAHHRTFRLTPPQIEALLRLEGDGPFEFTIDDELI